MTHNQAIAAFTECVNNPPAWAVADNGYEWTPRGYDEWYAPEVHRIEHAISAHIIGYKRHAYDFEPYWADESVRITDDDRCEGGCCDGYTRVIRWVPYRQDQTYYH